MTTTTPKPIMSNCLHQKEKIENEMGEPLNWHNPTDKRVCRIYLRCSADLENRDNWSKQHKLGTRKTGTSVQSFCDSG